jgi:hypothetical protein
LGSPTSGDEGVGTLNATGIFKNGSTVPAVNQSPTWTGNHTFSPASGVGIEINSVAGTQGIDINQASGAGYLSVSLASSAKAYFGTGGLISGAGSNDLAIRSANSAIRFSVDNGGSTSLTIASSGNITAAAPSSGVSLTAISNGAADAFQVNTNHAQGNGILFNDTNGSPQNFRIGLGIGDATASLVFYDSTNAAIRMKIANDGGVLAGAPTGGSEGAGTLNATGLFVNGTAVSLGGLTQTVTSSTWTLSAGCTTTPAFSITFTKIVNGSGVGSMAVKIPSQSCVTTTAPAGIGFTGACPSGLSSTFVAPWVFVNASGVIDGYITLNCGGGTMSINSLPAGTVLSGNFNTVANSANSETFNVAVP